VPAARLAAVTPAPERLRGEDRGPGVRINVHALTTRDRRDVQLEDPRMVGAGGVKPIGVGKKQVSGEQTPRALRHHSVRMNVTFRTTR
jgi:hypothetical protein